MSIYETFYMAKFPKIKKKANAFLVGEEGKISKKEIIRGGVLLTGAAGVILGSESASANTHTWTAEGDYAQHESCHDSY